MENLRIAFRAMIFGAAVEFALCVISVLSLFAGGVGPCGPAGNGAALIPLGLVALIHRPGFWLSEFVVGDYNALTMPLAAVFTTVLLSALAFAILKFRLARKNKSAYTNGSG